jgi:hypothetical protein
MKKKLFHLRYEARLGALALHSSRVIRMTVGSRTFHTTFMGSEVKSLNIC